MIAWMGFWRYIQVRHVDMVVEGLGIGVPVQGQVIY
jgi:hypothetical protein